MMKFKIFGVIVPEHVEEMKCYTYSIWALWL